MRALHPFALLLARSCATLVGLALSLGSAGCGGGAPSVTAPVRRCDQELVYVPEPGTQVEGAVRVAGEWNAFSESTGEVLTRREDGSHALTLTLPARDYGYRFVHDGQARLDPSNPYRRWVGNTEYSLLRVPDCGQPLLEVATFEASLGTLRVDARYLDGRHHAGVDPESVEVLLDGAPVEFTLNAAAGRLELSAQNLAQGKHEVRIRASDRAGRAAEPLYLPFWLEDAPFAWDGATMYFVFIDRFRNGDGTTDEAVAGVDPIANFRGGDLEGVLQSLEEGYFDALGVNVLWLSPLDENTDLAQPGTNGKLYSAYHGYWPTRARSVQRRFGTLETLRRLTDAAHARGIRVIADLVLNHVHRDHPYFVDERANGWFNVGNSCVCGAPGCDWEERRLDCWFTPYLPDINWRNPAVADRMAEDALGFLSDAGLDGFRLDAVKHMDHLAGRTISGRLNALTRVTGTPFFLIGETFTGTEGRALLAEYIGPHELDGQFDFPLYWMVVDTFAKGRGFPLLDDAVLQNEAFYAPGTVNGPFLGNHDVPRFLSIAAGEVEENSVDQAWSDRRPPEVSENDAAYRASKWAFTFLLTQPGVPLVYYGDEVGLPGAGDPDNRRPMRFGAQLSARQSELLEWVRRLGTLRREVPALRSRDRSTLAVEDDLYVYARDAGRALVAFNRSDTERTLTLGGLQAFGDGTYTDRLGTGRASVLGGQLHLTLPPNGASVFVR